MCSFFYFYYRKRLKLLYVLVIRNKLILKTYCFLIEGRLEGKRTRLNVIFEQAEKKQKKKEYRFMASKSAQ